MARSVPISIYSSKAFSIHPSIHPFYFIFLHAGIFQPTETVEAAAAPSGEADEVDGDDDEERDSNNKGKMNPLTGKAIPRSSYSFHVNKVVLAEATKKRAREAKDIWLTAVVVNINEVV